MNRIESKIPGVCLLEPKGYGDDRSYFWESYRKDTLAALGIDLNFVQDNQSLSRRNVLRGLHYQLGRPQAKLVRVLQGEVFDVAVDVRRGSPTFGQAVGEILSGDNRRLMFVPAGFAHGFLVLSETAEFLYKCSDFYVPAEERGIVWNDPQLGIAWPLKDRIPALNPRDSTYPRLAVAPEEDLPVYAAK